MDITWILKGALGFRLDIAWIETWRLDFQVGNLDFAWILLGLKRRAWIFKFGNLDVGWISKSGTWILVGFPSLARIMAFGYPKYDMDFQDALFCPFYISYISNS